MGHIEIAPWEPEETVGKLWLLIASRMDPPPRYPEAAVSFEDMRGRKLLLFTSAWNVNWASERNADLELSEVGNFSI